jgi:hypothetical protein
VVKVWVYLGEDASVFLIRLFLPNRSTSGGRDSDKMKLAKEMVVLRHGTLSSIHLHRL